MQTDQGASEHLPHRDTDITRPINAFRAADTAISLAVVFVSLGIVGLPFGAAMISYSVEFYDMPDSTLLAWMARNWYPIALVQYALIIPIWFFALSSMRPFLSLLSLALFGAWVTIATVASPLPDLSYAQSFQIIGLLGGLALNIGLYAVLAILLVRAPLAALFLGRRGRIMARPLPPVRGYFDLVRTTFGVWPNLRRSWFGAAFSSILMYGAIVLSSLVIMLRLTLIVTAIVQIFNTLFIFLPRALGSSYYSPYEFSPSFTQVVIGSVAFIVLFVVAWLLTNLIQWLSRRLREGARWFSRQSLEGQIARDERPPILFLRSFADDQVTLPPYGFWTGFLRGERSERRLDHLLVEQFTRYGPVVAIGKPGEPDLPFGAARKYVSNDTWQTEVEALANRAGHIIMVADPSPGVAWEVAFMLSKYRDKTLFLAPPSKDDLMLNPVFRQWTSNTTKIEIGTKFLIGLFHGADGTLEALLTRKPSADAYQVALQAFFRRSALPAN